MKQITDLDIHNRDHHPIIEGITQDVLRRARNYDSAYVVLTNWFRVHGWIFGQGHNGKWGIQSCAPTTMGINGPIFDTFGEMLEYLLTEIENTH